MKKVFLALIIAASLLLLSACAQFQAFEASEIRLISREEGVKAVLYPQDEDYMMLIEACTGCIDTDIPACPFGISEMQFVIGEKTISVYPAGDQCTKFALGELESGKELSVVYITEDKMNIIHDVLNKYGIQTQGA